MDLYYPSLKETNLDISLDSFSTKEKNSFLIDKISCNKNLSLFLSNFPIVVADMDKPELSQFTEGNYYVNICVAVEPNTHNLVAATYCSEDFKQNISFNHIEEFCDIFEKCGCEVLSNAYEIDLCLSNFCQEDSIYGSKEDFFNDFYNSLYSMDSSVLLVDLDSMRQYSLVLFVDFEKCNESFEANRFTDYQLNLVSDISSISMFNHAVVASHCSYVNNYIQKSDLFYGQIFV